jgi:hypothetical protein
VAPFAQALNRGEEGSGAAAAAGGGRGRRSWSKAVEAIKEDGDDEADASKEAISCRGIRRESTEGVRVRKAAPNVLARVPAESGGGGVGAGCTTAPVSSRFSSSICTDSRACCCCPSSAFVPSSDPAPAPVSGTHPTHPTTVLTELEWEARAAAATPFPPVLTGVNDTLLAQTAIDTSTSSSSSPAPSFSFPTPSPTVARSPDRPSKGSRTRNDKLGKAPGLGP